MKGAKELFIRKNSVLKKRINDISEITQVYVIRHNFNIKMFSETSLFIIMCKVVTIALSTLDKIMKSIFAVFLWQDQDFKIFLNGDKITLRINKYVLRDYNYSRCWTWLMVTRMWQSRLWSCITHTLQIHCAENSYLSHN